MLLVVCKLEKSKVEKAEKLNIELHIRLLASATSPLGARNAKARWFVFATYFFGVVIFVFDFKCQHLHEISAQQNGKK